MFTCSTAISDISLVALVENVWLPSMKWSNERENSLVSCPEQI